jgi:predicted DNA-binding transcriptional regulator AlpA
MDQPPVILTKLGYRDHEAAALIGVSVSKFRDLVKSGRMPESRRIDGCAIWRGDELLAAFNDLTNTASPSDEDDGEGWDDVLGDSAA